MECAHENYKVEVTVSFLVSWFFIFYGGSASHKFSYIVFHQAEKLKRSLETEVISLRERVSELEKESGLKSEEVASAVAGREEALSSYVAGITNLKEEISVKAWVSATLYCFLNMQTYLVSCLIFNFRSQIMTMEIQISCLREDLEKEHQKWRASQSNYERHVSFILFNIHHQKLILACTGILRACCIFSQAWKMPILLSN